MPHRDAIQTLIEDEDPARRIDAHMLLGRRALTRDDEDSARHHFLEAVDLDPTDERPRTALLEIEGAKGRDARATKPRTGRMGFWRWLFRLDSAQA